MKIPNKFILIVFCLLCFFLSSNYLFSAEGYIGESDLFVEGDRWELFHDKNKLIITGQAKAKSKNFTLWSDKLTVYYDENTKEGKESKSNKDIKQLIAEKNVIIDLENGYTSFSEKAEYFRSTQKVILTESPVVKSETNEVKGCIITYDLVSKSYTIDSCPDEKAGTIIKE